MTFFVFQYEISGRDNKDEQLPKILLKLLILEVFHLEISGKDFNDQQ